MRDCNPQEEQIEQIYKETYPALLAYAEKGLRNYAIAEEAVQDTFCIACAKSDEFLRSGNPKGWLMKTLKYVIRNTARQRAKMGKLAVLSLATDEAACLAACDEENVDILYGDVAKREDFQLFKRIVLDHYSMKEAAAEFGITVEACKKRVQRIRAFLREKFSQD